MKQQAEIPRVLNVPALIAAAFPRFSHSDIRRAVF
jgi:hypothetical protein